MRERNVGKAIEYSAQYVVAANMFDAAVNLLNLMHVPTLSHHVTRAIALITQSVLQTVHDSARRLSELRLLTHPNVFTRELTKAAISVHQTPLGLDDDLAKLPRLAAEARLKSAKDGLSQDRRGGRGRRGRGRGRFANHD